MILLCAVTGTIPWKPAIKLVTRLPGDLRCVSATGRLAADDLPSLIAIYAPTHPGHCQYISVFILVYRVQVQMSIVCISSSTAELNHPKIIKRNGSVTITRAFRFTRF